MDNGGLNMRNWAYYTNPSLSKSHLDLQLMPIVSQGVTKSFLPGHSIPNAPVNPTVSLQPRNWMVPGVPLRDYIDYPRESWVNPMDKFMNVLPSSSIVPEPVEAHTLHMQQQHKHDYSKEEEPSVEDELSPMKKKRSNGAPKISRTKKQKKNMDVVIKGIVLDISNIPIPICTCTEIPQQCYRWGYGGWQSACCTKSLSMHPLPMNAKRRGTRIAGRKMSQGAFKKVLGKLADEGYNFSNPIDLKTCWAKHGTNKFVTIR